MLDPDCDVVEAHGVPTDEANGNELEIRVLLRSENTRVCATGVCA